MKKLLSILLFLPMIGLGQKTYIPDDYFENYLEVNGMGDGIALNDSVLTSNIENLDVLSLYNLNISDLTGIEDFVALTNFFCGYNQLTNIDISTNTLLTHFSCPYNQLTSLDLSQHSALTFLECNNNQLTTLDLSNNTALTELVCEENQLITLDLSNNTSLNYLTCNNNQLTNLDLSNNTALTELACEENQLISLDLSNNIDLSFFSCGNPQLQCLNISNGNNLALDNCTITYCPLLNCIESDDSTYMNNNWQTHFWFGQNNFIYPEYYFSNNCSNNCSLAYIKEDYIIKKHVKFIVDLLGRDTKGTKNQPLFYIYDDGTVEKKVIIE